MSGHEERLDAAAATEVEAELGRTPHRQVAEQNGRVADAGDVVGARVAALRVRGDVVIAMGNHPHRSPEPAGFALGDPELLQRDGRQTGQGAVPGG